MGVTCGSEQAKVTLPWKVIKGGKIIDNIQAVAFFSSSEYLAASMTAGEKYNVTLLYININAQKCVYNIEIRRFLRLVKASFFLRYCITFQSFQEWVLHCFFNAYMNTVVELVSWAKEMHILDCTRSKSELSGSILSMVKGSGLSSVVDLMIWMYNTSGHTGEG